MSDSIYFIADVHLSPQLPERTRLFLSFLDIVKQRGGSLYILGDLFDFWVGPKHATLHDHQAALKKLQAISRCGVKVMFLYGNRDFYFDSNIARKYGMEVLGDETVINDHGRRILLTHGDLFCTKDHSYRLCRRIFRSNLFRIIFKRLPVTWSYALARFYRHLSMHLVPRKHPTRRNITPEAVQAAFDSGMNLIICGHGHDQLSKDYTRNGKQQLPYMLGDWSDKGSYLELKDAELTFQSVEKNDYHGDVEHGN